MPMPAGQSYNIHEVSFKNGSRKEFFKNTQGISLMTGDMVAVETDSGFDVGRISLSGELARLQSAKRKGDKRRRSEVRKILRKARYNDINKLDEARAQEDKTMFRAREIAMELKLDMKIGDVEFQADRRKATFYYTAEDRVDFRELIKRFAREFQIKVEMRQIGARQEAGKIGGIGSCGRELCCSTWLTEFKSVSTAAARYQNLAINQTKLSGQCGRLKCCLNFELDTYMDALKVFPKGAKMLKTADGDAYLQKTDIFRSLMYYTLSESSTIVSLEPDKVREILELNKKGEVAGSILEFDMSPVVEEEEEPEFIDDARVSLRTLERTTRKRRGQKGRSKRSGGSGNSGSGDKENKGGRSRSGNRRGKPQTAGQAGGGKEGQQKTRSGQNKSGNPKAKSGSGNRRKGQGGKNPNNRNQAQNKPKAEGASGKSTNRNRSNRNRSRGGRRKGGGENNNAKPKTDS